MYRSWAYILMAVATLAGVVALLWPSPTVRTIGEISMPPARSAPPRAEAPAKPAKPAKTPGKPAPPPAAPAPPAVVKKMPGQNTTTRRAAPVLENGLQPNMFGNPAADRSSAGAGTPGDPDPAPPRPGSAAGARPSPPPPPPAPPVGGAAAPPQDR